ncbi:hypothetical protein QVA66_01390 [Staphylococcus chromogenes]|nr:hypothetical protein [Staphylococcus chromogenes]
MNAFPRVLIVPSSPALVSELAPADQSSRQLKQAAVAQLRTLGDYPHLRLAVLGQRTDHTRTQRTGSFAAWGAPSISGLQGEYLCDLLASYLLRCAGINLSCAPVNSMDHNADVLIVVVDGPAGLSDRAPLALIPSAGERMQWCRSVLLGQTSVPASEAELQADGLIQPEIWQQLHGVTPNRPRILTESMEHGVGRIVARWEGWNE